LPKSFIENNSGGYGKIQAADVGITHWQSTALFTVALKSLLGKSLCLLAEDEICSGRIVYLTVNPCSFRGEKIEELFFRGGKKLRKTLPVDNVDKLPVIKSGAPEMFIIGRKTKRAHKVQNRICRSAEAGNSAGVGRNLWFNKHYIKRFDFLHLSCIMVMVSRVVLYCCFSTAGDIE